VGAVEAGVGAVVHQRSAWRQYAAGLTQYGGEVVDVGGQPQGGDGGEDCVREGQGGCVGLDQRLTGGNSLLG
jgi:hypothetical protein